MSTSRREFLQAGIAASALSLSGGVVAASAPGGLPRRTAPEALSIEKVIFDRRFPVSVAFANEMMRQGVAGAPMEGDITDIWYNDFALRWKHDTAAIAGLTAYGPLFCLERLAWDHRRRVVFRVEHRRRETGGMEHLLSIPAASLGSAAALEREANWGCAVARLAAQCPNELAALSSAAIAAPAADPVDADGEPLFSWVIAPRRQG
jgi:hypothetical protein